MKVKVLAVLLLAVGLLFAGCSGTPPSGGGGGSAATTPTTTEAPSSGGTGGSENPYDTATEVSPPPDAADVHNMVKPILESAFGGAKLTSYYSGQTPGGQGLVLVYVVKEPVDAGRVQNVVNALKSKGYTSVYGGVSEDSVGYALKKGNEFIMLGGDIGSHEFAVTWSSQS